MPNPKRRHSNQRTRLRRTHYKLKGLNMSICTNCKGMVIPHRACPYCGYYKGRLVLEKKIKEKEDK
ncbi:MAG: 50S ribosomal protein L32 [Candidatus Omnitrophota bacterium]